MLQSKFFKKGLYKGLYISLFKGFMNGGIRCLDYGSHIPIFTGNLACFMLLFREWTGVGLRMLFDFDYLHPYEILIKPKDEFHRAPKPTPCATLAKPSFKRDL